MVTFREGRLSLTKVTSYRGIRIFRSSYMCFGGLPCPDKTDKPETVETQLDLLGMSRNSPVSLSRKPMFFVGIRSVRYVGVDMADNG